MNELDNLQRQVAKQQAEIERLSRGIALLAQQFDLFREEHQRLHSIAIAFAAQTNSDLDVMGDALNQVLPNLGLPQLARDRAN